MRPKDATYGDEIAWGGMRRAVRILAICARLNCEKIVWRVEEEVQETIKENPSGTAQPWRRELVSGGSGFTEELNHAEPPPL